MAQSNEGRLRSSVAGLLARRKCLATGGSGMKTSSLALRHRVFTEETQHLKYFFF